MYYSDSKALISIVIRFLLKEDLSLQIKSDRIMLIFARNAIECRIFCFNCDK